MEWGVVGGWRDGEEDLEGQKAWGREGGWLPWGLLGWLHIGQRIELLSRIFVLHILVLVNLIERCETSRWQVRVVRLKAAAFMGQEKPCNHQHTRTAAQAQRAK